MEFIASFMQNDDAAIGISIFALALGAVGAILLTTLSVAAAVIYRIPGGAFTLSGLVVTLSMFAFAQIMTSTMELQYGPNDFIAQSSIYTLGTFLCILS